MCAPPAAAKPWDSSQPFTRDQPRFSRGAGRRAPRGRRGRVPSATGGLRTSPAAAAGDFVGPSLPQAAVTFAKPCAAPAQCAPGPAPARQVPPRARRATGPRPRQSVPAPPHSAPPPPAVSLPGPLKDNAGGEGAAQRAPTRRPATPAVSPPPARGTAPRLHVRPPPRLPPKSRSLRGDTGPLCGLIVRRPLARRPERGHKPDPGWGSPSPQPTARPGRAGVLAEPTARGAARPPQAGPGGPRRRTRPRPLGRGAAARPPRPPAVPAERRGGRRRRLLSLRGFRAAAERRAALACALRKAAAAPAPLAEGGRRRAAAAPLRYPATGLSAPPTGRVSYPSAQAPGLHQRRPPRPGPAPPAGRRAAGAGGWRVEAGAHPVCGGTPPTEGRAGAALCKHP